MLHLEKVNITLVALLLLMTGCGGSPQTGSKFNAPYSVDVSAHYPKKELVLGDLMDVEYIPLETRNEFLCQGNVQAIGKDIILVTNNRSVNSDGNIYVFDRHGKGLRTFNRLGKGNEEYADIRGITLDEDNNELFINELFAKRILVYDLAGKYKRTINYEEARYINIYNYDRESLICHSSNGGPANEADDFFIISKQDGSVIREIKINTGQKKSTSMIRSSETAVSVAVVPNYIPMIPYRDSWILTVPSSDTIFSFLPDYSMKPFIIRTPSIQSMNPEVFLFPGIFTDRYCFMQAIKKEYDFDTNKGFPRTNLVLDILENTPYECSIRNDDYPSLETNMMHETINSEIAFWQKIEADALVESYEKGLLKGRLKEVAAALDEESNPVIMLVKYKK